MPGRPTRYNDELGAQICERIRTGATHKCAAESLGVSYSVFQEWKQRGEGPYRNRPASAAYAHFAQLVTRADAEAELRHTASLAKAAAGWDTNQVKRTTRTEIRMRTVKHADGTIVEEPITVPIVTEEVITGKEWDWKASLEYLKRRRRIDWGDSLDLRKLDDETLLRLLDRAEQAEGGGGTQGVAPGILAAIDSEPITR